MSNISIQNVNWTGWRLNKLNWGKKKGWVRGKSNIYQVNLQSPNQYTACCQTRPAVSYGIREVQARPTAKIQIRKFKGNRSKVPIVDGFVVASDQFLLQPQFTIVEHVNKAIRRNSSTAVTPRSDEMFDIDKGSPRPGTRTWCVGQKKSRNPSNP
jgi:hypothetical protein